MRNVESIKVLVAVVTVGVGLAGLMLAGWRGIQQEMWDMRQEMREEIQGLRRETREEIQGLRRETRQEMRDMRSHMSQVDSHIGELRERMGHVEGLLKGLRDAVAPRTASN